MVEIVLFKSSDEALARLTDVLHACYASLLEQGFEFTASRQTMETTRRRVESGECWVEVDDGEWVGSVTWYRPRGDHPVAHYRDKSVAHFGQLGVVPSFRGQGLGRSLVEAVEARAKATGHTVMALDTARPATGLVDLYKRWGYEPVGEHDWRPGVNYLSVVMAKRL
jgi:GNAT superfamily N-acetyltransferase